MNICNMSTSQLKNILSMVLTQATGNLAWQARWILCGRQTWSSYYHWRSGPTIMQQPRSQQTSRPLLLHSIIFKVTYLACLKFWWLVASSQLILFWILIEFHWFVHYVSLDCSDMAWQGRGGLASWLAMLAM